MEKTVNVKISVEDGFVDQVDLMAETSGRGIDDLFNSIPAVGKIYAAVKGAVRGGFRGAAFDG